MTIDELKLLCDREIARGNGGRMIYYLDLREKKSTKEKTYRAIKYGFTPVEVVTNTKDFVTLS